MINFLNLIEKENLKGNYQCIENILIKSFQIADNFVLILPENVSNKINLADIIDQALNLSKK